jgi:hypothetical protein
LNIEEALRNDLTLSRINSKIPAVSNDLRAANGDRVRAQLLRPGERARRFENREIAAPEVDGGRWPSDILAPVASLFQCLRRR